MTAPVAHDALFRAQHVGAGEVAALFDASPFLTHFELWHRKNGTIATPEFNADRPDGSPDDERIFWGVQLEPAIVAAAKHRWGYTDRNPAADLPPLSNGKGLGGHPDRRVACPQRGPGVLEVKTADWLIRKGWGDEPPLHYLIQNNTYQGLDGVAWGDVIVLVGGNKLERFCYDFRPKLYAEAEKRVAAFWQSIADNKPPRPDFTRDGDVIGDLYTPGDDGLIDLRGDNLAMDAACRWLEADRICKDAAKDRDAARAELLDKLETNGTGLLEGMVLKAPTVAASPDTEITAKMVGQVMKGRKAYRRFTVKERDNG